MILKNFRKLLNVVIGSYVTLLRETANIKSGALRDSFSKMESNKQIIVSMLYYGQYGNSYKDAENPINRLKSKIQSYTPKLYSALKNDLKIIIQEKNK